MNETDFFRNYPVSILRRSYQRSIGVTVKPNGVIRVTVAKLASKRAIWRFLEEVQDWIEKTQEEFRQLRAKYPPKAYSEGELFPFLGRDHQLRFLQSGRVAERSGRRAKPNVVVSDDRLVLVDSKDPAREVRQFYEKQGRHILADRVDEYVNEMGLAPKKVSFRAQKTRWGSCGSNKHITLNWKLVAAPLEVIDYVVVHELAHLKHQNHSQAFWTLVAQHSRGYKDHKNWLSSHQYSFDFLNKQSELY